MNTTSWLTILNKANPQPMLDEKSIAAAEQGAAAMVRRSDEQNPRLQQLAEERELAELEQVYSTLYDGSAKPYATIAEEQRVSITQLEQVLRRARESKLGEPDARGTTAQKKLMKIQTHLEGLRRKMTINLAKSEGSRKQREAFEKDGRMERLKELRQRQIERRSALIQSVDIEHAIQSL